MIVTFNSGGRQIPTDVFVPTSISPSGSLVIIAYGSDGLVDNSNGPWKTMIEDYAFELAGKGIFAAIPDYFSCTTTNAGQLNIADPEAYLKRVIENQAAWQQVLEDAATELPKVGSLSGVDASRIGFLGFSLGGYLCARAAKTPKAMVIYFAPRFLGLGLSNRLSVKSEIHHGEKDFLDYSMNAGLNAKELTSHGADCYLWPSYQGAVHGFVGNDSQNSEARRDSKARTLGFFLSHL